MPKKSCFFVHKTRIAKEVVVLRLKEIAIEQRPRERLKRGNAEGLKDSELIAILLQNGCQGENALDMSDRLISTFGLNQLNSLSLTELMKIKEMTATSLHFTPPHQRTTKLCAHPYTV